MNKRSVGKKGEEMAADFLTKAGYFILEENAHQRWGELDLIAKDPQTNEIVFVEVKLRKNRQFGRPEEGVNSTKLNNLIRAAERWINKQNTTDEIAWRMDLVGIEINKKKVEIQHLKNVTMG